MSMEAESGGAAVLLIPSVGLLCSPSVSCILGLNEPHPEPRGTQAQQSQLDHAELVMKGETHQNARDTLDVVREVRVKQKVICCDITFSSLTSWRSWRVADKTSQYFTRISEVGALQQGQVVRFSRSPGACPCKLTLVRNPN